MIRPLTLGVALALLANGCSLSGLPFWESTPSAQEIAADNARRMVLAPRLNTLGFNLFEKLQQQMPEESLAFSPASLGRTMLMAYAGARGSTREAMAAAIGLADPSDATLANWAAVTSPSLDKRGVTVKQADSAWIRANFAVQQSFKDSLQRMFNAEVNTFSSSADGTSRLRAWIKSGTNGFLDGGAFELKDEVMLALANLIYFKGKWEKQFDKLETLPRPFYRTPQASKMVPTMHQHGHFRYVEDEGYQAIRLPYQVSAYSMYVLSPSQASASAHFDGERFERLLGKMSEQDGDLWLPRFTMKQKLKLTEPLKDLGMAIAFSEAADLSGIAQDLKLNQVDQEVRVQVDEEGTVAAAATVAVAGVTSAVSGPKPFIMDVNGPFFYVIRDDAAGVILFMGRVVQPE